MSGPQRPWQVTTLIVLAVILTVADTYVLITDGFHPNRYIPYVYPAAMVFWIFVSRFVIKRTPPDG